MKTCTKCHTELDLSCFHKSNRGKNGLMSWCKSCESERCRIKNQGNKDSRLAKAKEWRDNNKEVLDAGIKRWREQNPERTRQIYRDWRNANKDRAMPMTPPSNGPGGSDAVVETARQDAGSQTSGQTDVAPKKTAHVVQAVIAEELEARGWSQADLAFVLGWDVSQLNRLIKGKTDVTPDSANMLGDAFDMPAEFFMNLQKQYDLGRAKKADPGVKTRAPWAVMPS